MKKLSINKTILFNLLLLCIAVNLLSFVYLNFANRSVLFMTDYTQVHKMVLSKHSPYQSHFFASIKQSHDKPLVKISRTKNLNTPTMNWLQKPLFKLSRLPYESTLAWFLLSLVLVLISVYLIWLALRDRGKSVFSFWAVTLLLLLSWVAYTFFY